MTTTGSGNNWSKKDKYSICPNCKKKGRYLSGYIDNDGNQYRMYLCKYCDN